MSVGIVWFRKDLRLTDNPAWSAATRRHSTVVPLFVIDPKLWDRCRDSRVALLAANLRSLDGRLAEEGGRLRVEIGAPEEVVPRTATKTAAEDVTINSDVTPYARRRDEAVARRISLRRYHGSLVHPPGSVLTQKGDRYRVFTSFSEAWLERPTEPIPPPGHASISSDPGNGIPVTSPPLHQSGEEAAMERLAAFDPDRYADERDRPDLDSTSRLSIDLKYGTLSPSTVYEHIGRSTPGRRAFVRQLAWRDFHAHLLDELPQLVTHAMKPAYDKVGWRDDPGGFESWCTGSTGYPIVDAGMRQLQAEGWIHNRVRLIAASFLVKHLLIDWRKGERWYRHHLLDGDVAQNVGNWQWVTGSGADAAPYFRIFNPVTQAKRFDPNGHYIRRWVPELAGVPAPEIHTPWEVGPIELALWGGDRYPPPIVDLAAARQRTLDAYRAALG